MTSFREFYKSHPELLYEMPSRYGMSFPDPMLDNISVNIEDTRSTVMSKMQKVAEVNLVDRRFDLYRDDYSLGYFEDSWVDTIVEATAVRFSFKGVENGVQATGVHQLSQYPSCARLLFFDYYPINFVFIQSDAKHTTQGEKYWKKIIDEATKKDYKVTVFDNFHERETKVFLDDLEQYWGQGSVFERFQFRVHSKTVR